MGDGMSKLQTIRQAAGKSQSQLAAEIGISLSTLQAWEQGKRDINKASGENLRKLANALGCGIEDIMEESL